MKPKHVVNISIHSETPQDYLSDVEIKAMLGHLKDYADAGQPVPDAVKEKARQMGIEVQA